MRDQFKRLRPLLQDWGTWRRMRLNIGYPHQAISCNPDLHIANPILEPSFIFPSYRYSQSRTLTENEIFNRQRRLIRERQLREHFHIKRSETKPRRRSIVPNYKPHSDMALIDKRVAGLSDGLKQIIKLRYEQELKTKEIPKIIHRSLDTVNKQLARAHKILSDLPDKLKNK